MGATKSITGLFANVCGRITRVRIMRKQLIAGQGTFSAAAQDNPSLAHFLLRHFSAWQEWAIDASRWLLKRLGGQLKSDLSTVALATSGVLSPAYCPADCPAHGGSLPAYGRQAVRRLRGDRRFAR